MIEFGKIEQAYKDGLAIREKLTDSTPKFIKGVLDKIVIITGVFQKCGKVMSITIREIYNSTTAERKPKISY